MRFSKQLVLLTTLLTLVIGLLPIAAQSSVTLVVWDSWTGDAEQALINQLDQQFEDTHSGVTIQRQAYTRADLASMLPTVLTQPNAPDVVLVEQSQVSSLVQAHLLLALGDYADEYSWWDRSGQDLQRRIGISGELYGVPVTAELVGMFYNKAIFSQLNQSAPVTWDDLETDLLSSKDAGLTSITFGNADGSAGVDTFSALAYAYSDIQDFEGLLSRSPGAAFLTEGNLEAAQNLADWLDKGYFSPNFAAMDNEAALAEFMSGKSATWLTSSNNSSAINATLGDQVSFFLLPSPIGDSVTPTVGGFDRAYGVSKSSANVFLATQYIDLMTNSDTANALLNIGLLPVTRIDPARLQEGTLMSDLVNAWETIFSAGRVGQHFDAILPNIGAQIQALASHRLDPEAFVNAVQQDYEAGT